MSFPVPASIVSAAAPPVKLSLAFDPFIMSLPLVPVTVTPEPEELASTTTLSISTAKEFSKLKFAKFMLD